MEINDDEPAVEIPLIFSETIPAKFRELTPKDNGTLKLGPPSVKQNPVRCAFYRPVIEGLVLGMDCGDVLHWRQGKQKAKKVEKIGNHKGTVTTVYSPIGKETACGNLILSGSADGTVKIWGGEGKIGGWVCTQTLYGHGGSVLAIECVADYIVTGGTDKKVRVWAAVQGRKALSYPWFELQAAVVTMDGWVHDMCFPAEQKLGHGAALFVADSSGAIIKILPEGSIDARTRRLGSHLQWIVDGRMASDSPDAPALAFRKMQERGVSRVVYVPGKQLVLTLSNDNCLRVYDAKEGILKHCWENENGCQFTGVVYDGKHCEILTSDRLGYLAVFCLKREKMIVTKRLTEKPIVSLLRRESCDDNIVVLDAEVQVWKILRDIGYNVVRGGHTGPVISLYTCTGGLGIIQREQDFRVFSASLDNTIRLWDPYDLGCLRCIDEDRSETSAMTFSETENVIITGHDDGALRIWNMDTGDCLDMVQHTNSVTSLEIAQVGRQDELLISSGYDGLICVWDVRCTRGSRPHLMGRIRANIIDRLPGGASFLYNDSRPEVLCLRYDRNKKTIFSGGNDCYIKGWSVTTYDYLGKHIGHMEPVTCLALDANFLVSGSEDRSIRVWDALPAPPAGVCYNVSPFSGGTLLKTLEGHRGSVTGLAVIKTSGHVVSCSTDGQLLIWDYVKGEVLRRHEHGQEMLCLALRFDADEILVGTRQCDILRLPAGEPVCKRENGRR